MKTRNIILYFIALLAFCSCDDMFSPIDENTRQEDAMEQESEYAFGLLMYGYSRLPYQNTTQTDIATDDAVTNVLTNNYQTMASGGTWAADNDPMTQWNSCKDGIQYINKFLTLVEKVSWAPSSASKQQMFIDRMKGESFALRAILNYYLLQAHSGYAEDGVLYGVPLLTKPEDASSNFNKPRATFAACVKQIYDDCDSAMNLLPYDYANISSHAEIPEHMIHKDVYDSLQVEISGYNGVFGLNSRNLVSAKAAEAVKAQVALLAASPAYREQSGVTSEEAAQLCANVINRIGGLKGLDPQGHVNWYSYSYKSLIESSLLPELLWHTDRSKDNNQEKSNFPPSLYGGGAINPSQNLVDAFPMNNGLPITDPASGYDPQNPYANRDKRLSNCVIYNGLKFKSAEIITAANMPYGKNETDDNINQTEKSTRTGYYLKKLLREDIILNPSATTQMHCYPRIRYTEIFLAFAEAINDAVGPNDHIKIKVMEDGKVKEQEFKLSAYDVIKAIRERAGIGSDEFGRPLAGGDKYIEQIKNDKEKMAELIRNERRLELCFENKRFWDLRRWKMPLNVTVQGMKIERSDPDNADSPLKYTVIDVEDRIFTHKDGTYQWYGPIPRAEILKWDNLKQNVGWY